MSGLVIFIAVIVGVIIVLEVQHRRHRDPHRLTRDQPAIYPRPGDFSHGVW